MLMIAIDNPTEAAAMQMIASRKWIVLFSKIVEMGGLVSPHYQRFKFFADWHFRVQFHRSTHALP